MQAINLTLFRLADFPIRKRDEVVAEDGGRSCRNRACRSLRTVEFVSGHTVFRRDLWADHLKEVELQRHLEQRASVCGIGM